MYVKNIKLECFRNYTATTARFSNGINVIIGDNGQGKTNLLESVFFLSGGRSFKTRYDKELIGFGCDRAKISGEIFSQEREQKIEAVLTRGQKKQIILNGIRIKSASELSGKLLVVLFCPDDLSIVRQGPIRRRKLMDTAISQLRPKYAANLNEFNRLYDHKVRILKDFHKKPSLLETIDEFNLRLAKIGAELVYYRAAFVRKMEKYANKIHYDFSGGRETLALSYHTVKTIDDTTKKPSEIFPLLMEHQKSHRQAEIDSGFCLSGVHKDDMEIIINGITARSFASQGQARTAALSIKLAERDIFFDDKREYPVLLLDDVLSELDPTRQDFVLNRIRCGQVFITCCEDGKIARRTGGDILHVAKGNVL